MIAIIVAAGYYRAILQTVVDWRVVASRRILPIVLMRMIVDSRHGRHGTVRFPGARRILIIVLQQLAHWQSVLSRRGVTGILTAVVRIVIMMVMVMVEDPGVRRRNMLNLRGGLLLQQDTSVLKMTSMSSEKRRGFSRIPTASRGCRCRRSRSCNGNGMKSRARCRSLNSGNRHCCWWWQRESRHKRHVYRRSSAVQSARIQRLLRVTNEIGDRRCAVTRSGQTNRVVTENSGYSCDRRSTEARRVFPEIARFPRRGDYRGGGVSAGREQMLRLMTDVLMVLMDTSVVLVMNAAASGLISGNDCFLVRVRSAGWRSCRARRSWRPDGRSCRRGRGWLMLRRGRAVIARRALRRVAAFGTGRRRGGRPRGRRRRYQGCPSCFQCLVVISDRIDASRGDIRCRIAIVIVDAQRLVGIEAVGSRHRLATDAQYLARLALAIRQHVLIIVDPRINVRLDFPMVLMIQTLDTTTMLHKLHYSCEFAECTLFVTSLNFFRVAYSVPFISLPFTDCDAVDFSSWHRFRIGTKLLNFYILISRCNSVTV